MILYSRSLPEISQLKNHKRSTHPVFVIQSRVLYSILDPFPLLYTYQTFHNHIDDSIIYALRKLVFLETYIEWIDIEV